MTDTCEHPADCVYTDHVRGDTHCDACGQVISQRDAPGAVAVESNPTAFVNLVQSGEDAPLTPEQQAYIDATQLAYEALVTETYERVKAELEANPEGT